MNSSAADAETTASCKSFAINFHCRCLQGWIDTTWNGSKSTMLWMGSLLQTCEEGGYYTFGVGVTNSIRVRKLDRYRPTFST